MTPCPASWPRTSPTCGGVHERLGHLFEVGSPPGKLAAALALAPRRPECADFGFASLLEAEAETIGPMALLLQSRMPSLVPRLEAEADRVALKEIEAGHEQADRRLANVACALAILGRPGRAETLLGMGSPLRPRAFLVHRLGPSGVAPRLLLERLAWAREPALRRALILSLGEVPEPRWDRPDRDWATKLALELYQLDPDPGVHGAARWLLCQWGLDDRMRETDALLIAGPHPPDRRWRVDPSGLTFVTIEDPALDRVIEISDTEVTVDLFRRFRPGHRFAEENSPSGSCPINATTYLDAAAFCNWLGQRSGLPAEALCYRGPADNPASLEAAPGWRDRAGYRLPDVSEFVAACRADADETPRCPHGDSEALLGRYAWHLENAGSQAHPVARLKPNDYGLFDMLGNVGEWCEAPAGARGRNQAILGFSFAASSRGIDQRSPRMIRSFDKTIALQTDGFRVVRTLRAGGSAPGL